MLFPITCSRGHSNHCALCWIFAGLWTVHDRRSEIHAGWLSFDSRTGKL